MRTIPATVVWLTLLWVMLWGNVSVANVASGLVVAVAVLTFARRPSIRAVTRDDAAHLDPIAIVRFATYLVVKLIEANLILAWEIITPRNRINTGVVAVPLRTSSEIAMLVVANVITLTPGSVTIEAKGSPPVLYVHVLHLHDIARVRRDLLRIEQLSVLAFGSLNARAELSERVAP